MATPRLLKFMTTSPRRLGLAQLAWALGLALVICLQLIDARPPSRRGIPIESAGQSRPGPPGREPRANDGGLLDPRDCVESEDEFAKLLEQFRDDARLRIAASQGDFVSDDVDLDELLKFLDEKDALDALAAVEANSSTVGDSANGTSRTTSITGAPEARDEGAEVQRLIDANEGQPEATTTQPEPRPESQTGPPRAHKTGPTRATVEAALPVVASDEEYEEILKRLREEAMGVGAHPADYVADEDELLFVKDKLEDGDLSSFAKSRMDRWERSLPLVAAKCVICLDEMEPDEQQMPLPCGHKFHKHCLTEWAKQCPSFSIDMLSGKTVSCPVCRRLYLVKGTI